MGTQLLFHHNFSPWSLHGRLKPTCWINASMKRRPAHRIREHLLTAKVVTRAKPPGESKLVVGLGSSEAFDKVNWPLLWFPQRERQLKVRISFHVPGFQIPAVRSLRGRCLSMFCLWKLLFSIATLNSMQWRCGNALDNSTSRERSCVQLARVGE